jgi:nucleotide-binding universal stress UspA family protein
MARRLIVGHDGSRASTRALLHAAALARAEHGRLTVLFAIPRIPRCIVFAPVSYPALEREARAAAERELARGIEAIDPHVSVTTLCTRGPLGAGLIDLWRRGEHDAVVLASGPALCPRTRAARRLLRAGAEPILFPAPERRRRRRWRPMRTRRTRPARRARPA